MGQAVVASDTPTYFDQSITMEGATAPVAPDIESYAEESMPVYRANPPLNRAPMAFPVVEWQPRNSPATTSAEAARRDLSLASIRSETSGEPERYRCQWVGCSADPMTETEIFLHFLAHGEKDKETGRVKECKWAGCTSRAFPVTWDGFRRHVFETQSHDVIRILTGVVCEKCGEKRARRAMPNHRNSCSGRPKAPEGNGKQRQV